MESREIANALIMTNCPQHGKRTGMKYSFVFCLIWRNVNAGCPGTECLISFNELIFKYTKYFVILYVAMKKQTVKKDTIIKSVSKMIADKEAVRSYVKGKISKEALHEKGIKLVNPL